jgi:ATP adenylyltransferase
MEKLWSPWRSQYIDAFKEDKKEDVCVLCAAGKLEVDDEKNLLISKGKTAFTVLNLYPYNNGHLMVVPFRHTEDLFSLSAEENLEIMETIQKSAKALKEIYSPEGFNIGANIGKVSGAGIDDHIHFHIVPRWNGDTNFMPVLGEVKIISQDLLVTKKKLLDVYK